MSNLSPSLGSYAPIAPSAPPLGGWDEHVTLLHPTPAFDGQSIPQCERQSPPSIASLLGGSSLPVDQERSSRLLTARLGIAAGLFTALRYKHAETAAHS